MPWQATMEASTASNKAPPQLPLPPGPHDQTAFLALPLPPHAAPRPTTTDDSSGPPKLPPASGQLPPTHQLHILSLLPHNDRALSGRLVSPDAAAGLSGPEHCTAFLSQPLPQHAAASAVEAAQQHVRQLPFRHKLGLLCTAAASGIEVNLEVALAALQPSIFPELFQGVGEDMWRFRYGPGGRCVIDPALAAVKAGHTHMLSTLVERCPALVHPVDVLEAAARDCSLVDLQLAWNAFRRGCSSSSFYTPDDVEYVLNAAAGSATGDAVAKMGWVVAVGEGRCRPGYQTLLAAVRSGDTARVQWVRDHDSSCDDLAGSITAALEAALEHADLAMAQWLVHETGCDLSKDSDRGMLGIWMFSTLAASRGADGAAKHRWLREQGAVIMSPEACVLAAMKRGHLDTVRYLLEHHCPSLLQQSGVYHSLISEVLGEGGNVALAEYLYQAGVELDLNAFPPACAAGHLDLIQWLVDEAGVSAAGGLALCELIDLWPCVTPADSAPLLEAVKLLVSAGGVAHGWDTQRTLAAAARRGDLALVQYLLRLAPGHVPGRELMTAAVRGGCVALLEWLVEQQPGCLDSLRGDSTSAYMVAAKEGDLGTVTALRRLGLPWGAGGVVDRAVREGCEVAVVRGLWELGAPMADRHWVMDTVFARERARGRELSSDSIQWVVRMVASARKPPEAAGQQERGV